MASGDTKLTICSDAMISIGSSPISSFAEATTASQVADRLYDDVRDQLLLQYPWSWAVKKAKLARLETAPTTEWKYRYQLPGDLLGVPQAVFTDNASRSRPARDWEIYGTELLCDYEEVWIDYQYRPDETAFPPYFVRLLRAALAAEFAIPVTDSTGKAGYWQQMAFGSPAENMRGGLLRVAMNIDGGRPPQAFEDFPLVDVRG